MHRPAFEIDNGINVEIPPSTFGALRPNVPIAPPNLGDDFVGQGENKGQTSLGISKGA